MPSLRVAFGPQRVDRREVLHDDPKTPGVAGRERAFQARLCVPLRLVETIAGDQIGGEIHEADRIGVGRRRLGGFECERDRLVEAAEAIREFGEVDRDVDDSAGVFEIAKSGKRFLEIALRLAVFAGAEVRDRQILRGDRRGLR